MRSLIITLLALGCALLRQSAFVYATPTITSFDNGPDRLFYFEDSTVVLYHDPKGKNVYISENEGKEWKLVPSVPEGKTAMFIEHPFSKKTAYIITTGNQHWRTTDRGKLWQSFDVPLEASNTLSPLSFHADPKKEDYVLYSGQKCEGLIPWLMDCDDYTYYTTDGFTSIDTLMSFTTSCSFAHSTKWAVSKDGQDSSNLILCVAFEGNTKGSHTIEQSRLYSSDNFFKGNTRTLVDFGSSNPKASKGVVALGVVSKFLVAAVKNLVSAEGDNSEMILYVSVDGVNWAQGKFPHGSNSKLLENAYTIVESTTHSLAVDVLTHTQSTIGTLFLSNSNGTYFVESLRNTNRNDRGYVDFEDVYGVDGVGLANIVVNADEVEGRKAQKQLQSRITFDDGRSWIPIAAPAQDVDGKNLPCSSTTESCSLHLHSITVPHNLGRIFSTPGAPGVLMGVGSVGAALKEYIDCDTFLSRDAGLSWEMVLKGPKIWEIGDNGGVLVAFSDDEPTDVVDYSFDDGKSWQTLAIGKKFTSAILTTVPDSTSRKFLLVGSLSREAGGGPAVAFIDFAADGGGDKQPKCSEGDMQKWYARAGSSNNKDVRECIMGRKQWYWRRAPGKKCYVGDKFNEPEEHDENCPCAEEDYECDYNFIRQQGVCVAAGPEPIPAGVCPGHRDDETYMGSSGYRLIPGNTCTKGNGGLVKDDPVSKSCSKAQPPEGKAVHQLFEFKQQYATHYWFKDSKTVLVQLRDGTVWQSGNEGYSWAQPLEDRMIQSVWMHGYSNDRAYMIAKDKIFVTTNTGKLWVERKLPSPPNAMNIPLIRTHPLQSDWLIYTGQEGCSAPPTGDCRAIAYYSTDHGYSWRKIEEYVRTCEWARDKELKIDSSLILCQSYRDKKGNQPDFSYANPMELIIGGNFYKKKTKLFDNVVGHAKFSEYLLVGEMTSTGALNLQVSLDGIHYHQAMFPPSMSVENHAYTVLESTTDAVFLHLTTSSTQGAEYGNILKSNSNGTFYGLSLENANRNLWGYVDFEKMIGLEGIAVINVVANPEDAAVTKAKRLQTRITHNDGGTWKTLTPPAQDSLGQRYKCDSVKCALHLHGYTERIDARATYSSPSAVGFMMAVGNVGEYLADYKDSDTFFTRDGGFTWEEIRKEAHLFEFGDSGSVLVLINDETFTDRVAYSTNEGISWKEYNFGVSLRALSLVTMTAETSRRFIVIGYLTNGNAAALHLDFTEITQRKCLLSTDDPANDDFELWSPSEERDEKCLFGRQTLYHRRIRDRDCWVGDQTLNSKKIVTNCTCTPADFECEYNHVRNAKGECVLQDGAAALHADTSETCIFDPDAESWYERTAYRKIVHSSCEGGSRPDRGPAHPCGGVRNRSSLFWLFMLFIPIAFAALIGYHYARNPRRAGTIRLPDHAAREQDFSHDSGPIATLASVPVFLAAAAMNAWAQLSNLQVWDNLRPPRTGGYRHVAVDEDAQVLRFEDE